MVANELSVLKRVRIEYLLFNFNILIKSLWPVYNYYSNQITSVDIKGYPILMRVF